MEKEWKVPVVWQMMGYMRVPAPTAEEALKRAQMLAKDCPLPDDGQYLDDSFEIDREGEPIEVKENQRVHGKTIRKYEFTGATKTIECDDGREKTLHRIRASRIFGSVRPGDLGGWIESEENLSHGGSCWVAEDACVYDTAKVYENAMVFGNAKVNGNARVSGNASISKHAHVTGQAFVTDRAVVTGHALVEGNALIYGYAELSGKAHVGEHSQVYGKEKITGQLPGSQKKGKGAFERIVLNAAGRAGKSRAVYEAKTAEPENER